VKPIEKLPVAERADAWNGARPQRPPLGCLCCGSAELVHKPALWRELIEEWRLSPYEAGYIDRQQGLECAVCGCNLRAMALGLAVMRCFGYSGLFDNFVQQESVGGLAILEINEAHRLGDFLADLPGRVLGSFPDVDMTSLPFADGSFDVVLHSDTLEHVPDPVKGLRECRRVLRSPGFCAFTVPLVVDRRTLSRAGLSSSYHGKPGERRSDHIVQTEYGCDAWEDVVKAGFEECRIYAVDPPAAFAIVGVK
jgi:SAM-dependent methyltransferase